MVLPPANFTPDDIESRVGKQILDFLCENRKIILSSNLGGDRYVDVVDVYTQHSYKMRLRTFLEFFRQSHRPKLYNLISLEFSDTE